MIVMIKLKGKVAVVLTALLTVVTEIRTLPLVKEEGPFRKK
jgi:hypothetical protein